VPVELASQLVEEGAVAQDAMEHALARQREAGGALDTALLELGLVGEDVLVDALARVTGLPSAPESAWTALDLRARRVFPAKVAERHGLVPFALDGRELHLVATWPVDLALLDEISFMLSLHLVPHVGPEWRVRELAHRLYGTPLPERLAALAAAPAPAPSADAPADDGFDLSEDASPAAVPPGFARDLTEPIEPLAAALAQAVELAELPFVEEEPTPAPAPAAELAAPPRWTFDAALAALAAASSRDEVVRVALRHARDFFEYAALFAVTRDAVAGHDALGLDEDARDRCRGTAMYATDAGVFRTAIEACSPYLGPIAPDAPGNDVVLAGLGRGTPRTVLVFPVVLRDRPVCILYADNGEAPVSAARLGELLLFLGGLGNAFERILRERKARWDAERASATPPDGGWHATEPARAAPPAPPVEVEVELDPYELTTQTPASAAPPTPAVPFDVTFAAIASADQPEPEPEPQPEPEPETEPEPEQDAAFSAPLEASLVPVAETPPPEPSAEPDAVPEPPAPGPVRLRASAPGTHERRTALGETLALLGDPDASRRREAVEALADAGDSASFMPLTDRVFDPDPGVADAARAALARHRRDPNLRLVPEKLRRALLSGLSDRATAAARALGALRDVESIAGLIQTLEVSGPGPADAAADALAVITLQRLGTDARRWLVWWKGNRGRGRAEWLFAGLASEDRAVRAAAAEELAEVAPPPAEYDVDQPREERERAARAWASGWAKSGRVI
jgi:hypothetical protein